MYDEHMKNIGGCFAFALGVSVVGCADADGGAGSEKTAAQVSPLYNAPIDTAHPFDVGICAGKLNTDPQYGEVGSCAGPPRTLPSAFNNRGSATLVAPNLVLTARHIFRNFADSPSDPNDCTYTLQDIRFPGGMRITTNHSTNVDHPTWIEVEDVSEPSGNVGCTDDLALLRLARNVTDVAPARLDLRHDLGRTPPRDGKLALVARGMLTPTDQGNRERRILRDLAFTCAGAPCELNYPFGGETLVFHVRDGMIGFGPGGLLGDSGSGALLNDTLDTKPTVVGVTTMSLRNDDGIPLHSVAIAVQPHRAWIAGVAREAARAGGYPTPDWARGDCDGDD